MMMVYHEKHMAEPQFEDKYNRIEQYEYITYHWLGFL